MARTLLFIHAVALFITNYSVCQTKCGLDRCLCVRQTTGDYVATCIMNDLNAKLPVFPKKIRAQVELVINVEGKFDTQTIGPISLLTGFKSISFKGVEKCMLMAVMNLQCEVIRQNFLYISLVCCTVQPYKFTWA